MRASALGVALAACALAALARAPAAGEGDPSCARTALVLRSGAVTYRLPWTFVREGSDSVWTRDGGWRRGVDYALDALRGELRVLREPTPGETLHVAACRLLAPPPLEVVHQRYAPPRAGAAAAGDTSAPVPPPAPRPATGRDPAVAPGGATFAVTGNKTLAVDFGSSQDAALRQSLDLAISGTLAPGVELTGVLSDRNTPLTAAGSTQDLKSLDKVLIELRAPNGAAALGDVGLALDQGEFARLDRRLQGARAEWRTGGLAGVAAAASAPGEYRRMQFFGIEGQQGPYLLTDRDGNTGISVVAGSENVTLDGQRLTRGEGADYVMDYEAARLTFSNRRPIGASSRITVEYQVALTRYRRNLAAAGARWAGGPWKLFANVASESDDRGRPLDTVFESSDRMTLSLAGDSASRAIGAAVTPGIGDYDTVRVDASTLVFAFAGPDSGGFAVRFSRVGTGLGDYADSAVVSGRTAYRWVGPGLGAFRVGRTLPLPESHALVSAGASARAGALTIETEGALSKLDRNTFSALDDDDDAGAAGRLTLGIETGAEAGRWGRAGLKVGARSVERRFAPFSRLERPYAEEDWGLPIGADLEHQRRADAEAFWLPRPGGDLRAGVSRLTTPDGYAGWLRRLDWSGGARLSTRFSWLRSDGTSDGFRFADGGRERLRGEARLVTKVLVPALRAEADRRTFPSDSVIASSRFAELGGELATGARWTWRALAGLSVRRDGLRSGAASGDFVDQNETRTLRASLETAPGGPLGASFAAQRRDVRPLADPRRSRSDLASLRLRVDDRRRGVSGALGLEITNEGENRRTRTLVFVGAGRGGYDAFGNFVGTGDYDLVLAVSRDLDRIARAATSGRASWTFGSSEVWRGSRVEFTVDTEARRRGDLRGMDALLSTGLALVDRGLSRAQVTQRLETELAPGARAASIRVRLERRVSADRSFANFEQTTDQRLGSLRWRARLSAATSLETEGRAQWQQAGQALAGAGRYQRTIAEQGGQSQLVWQPNPRWRTAAAVDASWSRPQGQAEPTRTLRLGPDLGVSVGARGRAELTVRRAFVSGPPALSLIPGVDPAGAARWDATARFDVRVHETTTFGISGSLRERPDRPTVATGRAELRAFF